ncbi:alpha/beta hydrolase [Kribbella sp. CA-293567]|uniref:alpha/beta hydrolase n=1 Tax=Kribbella sp. CA-293567 TaxID=3002436 RepID=UPI0022DDDC47|nr:alpha/beta hydrolase [Kribbella sp. CA-293567]WBQ08452.1 alpha/beta hydrolase [Kribbella sp. CA-293567]
MRCRRVARAGLALVVTAGLGGTLIIARPAIAEEARTPLAAAKPVELAWGKCPTGVAAGTPQLQCTKVPVPLDYSEPDGQKIEIAVSRLASAKPAERRGVLLLNPGGPGGAGLAQPAELVALGLPTTVSAAYDLIGMDPRGVGHSSPVSCGFRSDDEYAANIPPYAENSAAVARQAKIAERVASQCAANDKHRLLPHLSTANTARDMDRIRIALGEQKISYFGVSYGSALGSAYASMFRDRTDRIVLDSNPGTTSLDRAAVRRFGPGLEQRFPDFAKFAAERHAGYGLGRTPAEVRRNFFALAERLNRKPVNGIDGATFRLYLFAGSYGDSRFPLMAQIWQSLAGSDDAGVRRLRTDSWIPDAPALPGLSAGPATESAAPSPNDNAFSAFLAVTCNDTAWPTDVATYQRDVTKDRRRFPMFGAAGANISPCAYWPRPAEPPVRITKDGPANVLILQNLRDPATPHLGGVLLRKAFGHRARLVSVDGGEHGVYMYDDNPCALNVTTTYLVDGTLPRRDTFCSASTRSGLNLDAAAQRTRAAVLDRLLR